MYKVIVEHDHDTENPNDWNIDYQCYSSSPKHSNYKQDPKHNKETQDAYPLDCYQHGDIVWSLSGKGHQCDFDTARGVGVVIVPKGEDPQSTIDIMNQYLNGEIYQVCIQVETHCKACDRSEWDMHDSCAGFYGVESVKQYIAGEVVGEYKLEGVFGNEL